MRSRIWHWALLILLLISTGPPAAARDGETVAITVEATPISRFRIGSEVDRFGPFEFLGGIEIGSRASEFGGLSALRMMPDNERFIAVLDTGYWLTGRIDRDSAGRLSGISDAEITAMRDSSGQVVQNRKEVDAEGLTIDGDRVLVSYERRHRIDVFDLADIPTGAPIGQVDYLIPLSFRYWANHGLETLAIVPEGSPYEGAVIVISEKHLNQDGDIAAAITAGPDRGVFHVRRHAPYNITDGAFLPDGDLLLLERRFSFADGIGMRIRRISGSDIRPGATVDGPVLMDVDFGYQIDNMESLEVIAGPDGDTRILLASDDNYSMLQRSLLLEFRLLDSGY